MRHAVFAPDTLFAQPESVLEPGRLEVQRPIRVVPFADIAPAEPAPEEEERAWLRQLPKLTAAA